MRFRFVVGAALACTLAAQLPVGAPKIPANRAKGYATIQVSDLQRDVTYLASPELAGRMSLSEGADRAIHFVTDSFKQAGLQPIVNGTYLQPLAIVEYHPDLEKTSLTVKVGGEAHAYKFLKDFTGTYPEGQTVHGDLAFAGYGITAPEFGKYDDYAGLNVAGKIVVVFDHEPQEDDPKSIFNGVGNTRYANVRLKVINAQKHGAVAVLIANEPNRKHPSNIERLSRIKGIVERYRMMPQQALADSELRIPAFSINDNVVNDIFASSGRKASEVQAQLDKTLKPVALELRGASADMNIVNTDRRIATTYNVVGLLEGSDPKLKAETVVISAHYDHDGTYGGNTYPGADDNASGTAGVMELAKAFAANQARPKRSLLFVVFAAEERGLLGSYYYAAHPLRELKTTRAVINFDMIGRNEAPSAQTQGLMQIDPDTSNELNLIGTNNTPDYRATVAQEDQIVGLKINTKWDKDSALNVIQRSDQFPFTLKDVPAVWWFTGFHPDYHQPTDTADKLNYDKMARILKLSYLTAFRFGDTATPPTYHANVADCTCEVY